MKKAIILLVLVALISAGAFGQMKFGAGFLFDYNANNGLKSDTFKSGLINTSLGGFLFFDISYLEINASFAHGKIKPYLKGTGAPESVIFDELTFLQLELSIFGKFPINLGKIILFPMAGAGFNMVLSAKDKNGNSLYEGNYSSSAPALKDYSQFGLLAGVGFDVPFTARLFLRTEALFHFRFPNRLTKDLAEKEIFNTTYGVGPRIKVGIGYMF